jgi:hypothetical protein
MNTKHAKQIFKIRVGVRFAKENPQKDTDEIPFFISGAILCTCHFFNTFIPTKTYMANAA